MRIAAVIARNSSFVYKGKAVDTRQVGRELGVRYVLEGSVRKAGNRVRVTVQLISVAEEVPNVARPPPSPVVELPATVQSVSVVVPEKRVVTPPPSLPLT